MKCVTLGAAQRKEVALAGFQIGRRDGDFAQDPESEGGRPRIALTARLGQVTPARISQVMALLGLAPDLQEQVLLLPRTVRGHDPLQMYDLLPLTTVLDWKMQRRLWTQLLATRSFG